MTERMNHKFQGSITILLLERWCEYISCLGKVKKIVYIYKSSLKKIYSVFMILFH